MRARNRQGGIIRLQTLVIVLVATFIGMVAVPVWAGKASAPQDAVLTANSHAVAQVVALAIAGDASWLRVSPTTVSATQLRRALSRPLVNPLSHSAAMVVGEQWPKSDKAPALWITNRADLAPRAIATRPQIRGALAGTIMVLVRRSAIDVFAVPAGAGLGITVHRLPLAQ